MSSSSSEVPAEFLCECGKHIDDRSYEHLDSCRAAQEHEFGGTRDAYTALYLPNGEALTTNAYYLPSTYIGYEAPEYAQMGPTRPAHDNPSKDDNLPPLCLPRVYEEEYKSQGDELLQPMEEGSRRRTRVAIVGRAGAGKGSLMNCLMRRHIAFVDVAQGNSIASEPLPLTDDLELVDLPGYNGKHERRPNWLERLGRRISKKDVQKPIAVEGSSSPSHFLGLYEDVLQDTDAVLYVFDKRCSSQDWELVRKIVALKKMVYLVVTNCGSELDQAEYFEPEGQQHRQEFRQKYLDTCSMPFRMVVEQMPFFCVEVPWPHKPSQGQIANRLAENCSRFDFPALKTLLENRRGLCGQLQVMRHIKSSIEKKLDEYIAKQTSGKSVTTQAFIIAAAEFMSGGVGGVLKQISGLLSPALLLGKCVFTVLDMVERAGLLESYEVLMAQEEKRKREEKKKKEEQRKREEEDSGSDGESRSEQASAQVPSGMDPASIASAFLASNNQSGGSTGNGNQDALVPLRLQPIWRRRLEVALNSKDVQPAEADTSSGQPNIDLGTNFKIALSNLNGFADRLKDVFGPAFYQGVLQALIRKAIFESALALGTLSFLPGVNALAYASTIKMLLGKLRDSVVSQSLATHFAWIKRHTKLLLPTPKERGVPPEEFNDY